MTGPVKRILLVVRAGSLGDFILTLPALRALRIRFPKAHLEFIPQASMLDIVPDAYADRITSPEEHTGLECLFGSAGGLPAGIIEYCSGFDLIVWYGFDPDGVVLENLWKTGCGYALVANPFSQLGACVHAADSVLLTLRPFGISTDYADPVIGLSESSCAEARRLLGEHSSSLLCAVHPGSGSPSKNWAPRRFASVIRKLLVRNDMKVVLLSGPSDREATSGVMKHVHDLNVPVLELPLRRLAAVLSQCALFLGNDSGVAHLAAMLGTPAVVIFGPTDPRAWAPRGKHVAIVENPLGLDFIEAADVILAAERMLQSVDKFAKF